MPRKAKATEATEDGVAVEETSTETRRSTRIKAQPKPAPPKKKAPAKPRSKKEKAAPKDEEPKDEPMAEDGDATATAGTKRAADEAAEEPAAKKSKPASKAGSAKPASKAKADEKIDKEAEKPETIAEEGEEQATAAASKGLEIGDVLPDITLKNEKDESVSVAKLTEETGLVLFLFPKADTPGCTKQACGFRDNYEAFKELGYTVYGLSGDTSAAQTKWQTKNNLPYSFLSDPKKELIKALGAWAKTTKRSHFIFEKGGKLVDKKNPVKPEESFTQALEFVKSLSA